MANTTVLFDSVETFCHILLDENCYIVYKSNWSNVRKKISSNARLSKPVCWIDLTDRERSNFFQHRSSYCIMNFKQLDEMIYTTANEEDIYRFFFGCNDITLNRWIEWKYKVSYLEYKYHLGSKFKCDLFKYALTLSKSNGKIMGILLNHFLGISEYSDAKQEDKKSVPEQLVNLLENMH